MSRLLPPARWTRQPQIPVGIDSSNTITRLLRFAYNGATGIDHVYLRDKNPFPTVMPSGAPLRAAPKDGGRGRRQSGVGGDQLQIYFTDRVFPAPTSYSITLAVRFYAAADVDQKAFSFSDETYDRGFEIGTNWTNVNVWAKDNNSVDWAETAGPAYSAGDVIDAVVVVEAGAPLKLYVGKGGAVSNSASNYSNDSVGLSTVSLVVGSYNIAGSQPLNGIVTHAMVWDRALSKAEVMEVLRNPWQVFAPLPRVVLPVPAPAAPPVLSGTAGQWDKTLLLDGWFGEVAGIKGWYAVDFMAPAAAGGTVLKVWTGSAWVAKPLKRWNGSSWVAATLKRKAGSGWV